MRAAIHHAEGSEYFFREGCHISEWSNSDDDPALSVARARVEAGVVTLWHRLEGVTERYVVLSGTGRVELGKRAERIIEAVGPGSVVIIPPGVPQRIANTGSDDLVFLALCSPRFTPDCYLDCAPTEV
ncbi:MAG: cupin domain-containing protein [Zoogloeaceae bacterium]|nr:cupin domain-containing protein [Zoogloeaceae bacterium]